MTDFEDHLLHLQHSTVVDAERAWEYHVRGADDVPPCPDCQQGERHACPLGRTLHQAAVTAAQEEYRRAHPEAFVSEPSDG